MLVHVLKQIQVAGKGTLKPGWQGELHDSVAKLYLPSGAVELVKTRELRENPVRPAGVSLSASQAGQASPQTIASESDSGEPRRRRGRPRRAASS